MRGVHGLFQVMGISLCAAIIYRRAFTILTGNFIRQVRGGIVSIDGFPGLINSGGGVGQGNSTYSPNNTLRRKSGTRLALSIFRLTLTRFPPSIARNRVSAIFLRMFRFFGELSFRR
jgi:hypothetical protein